jgi:hypothetical protein
MSENIELNNKKAELDELNKTIEANEKTIDTETAFIKEEALKLINLGKEAGLTKQDLLDRGFDESDIDKVYPNENREISTMDKEFEDKRTPEERKVDEARGVYVKEYLKCKKEVRKQVAIDRTKATISNIFKSRADKKIINEEDYFTEEYKEAKKIYDQARVEMGNDLFNKKRNELIADGKSEPEIGEELKKYKAKDILEKTILDERQKLIDAKVNGSPVNPAAWKRVANWYMKLPREKKLLLNTVLFLGASSIAAGAVTGSLVGAAGFRFARGALSGFASAHLVKGIDLIERKSDEKFRKNQDDKLGALRDKFASGEIGLEDYEKGSRSVVAEETKRNRHRTILKAVVGAAVGAGVGAFAAHEFGSGIGGHGSTPGHNSANYNKPILEQPENQFPVENNQVAHDTINPIKPLTDSTLVKPVDHIVDSPSVKQAEIDTLNKSQPVDSSNINKTPGITEPVKTTIPTEVKVPAQSGIDAEIHKGHGAIQTIHDLQDKLHAKYDKILTETPDKVPESVKHILNTKADKLAIEYGMFKPGQVDESALTKIGGKFNVDDSGNVTYQESSGANATLLEKGTEIKANELYTGKMIDADHPKAGVETQLKGDDLKEYLRTHPKLRSDDFNSEGQRIRTYYDTDEYMKTHPQTLDDGVSTNPEIKTGDQLEYEKFHPKTSGEIIPANEDLINKPEASNIETSPNVDTNVDKVVSTSTPNTTTPSVPTERYYNTGGVKNIYPTGEGGNINIPRSSVSEGGDEFTTKVGMTKNAVSIENIPSDAIEVRSVNHGLIFENDPRHLATAREVNQQFGNNNVLLDRSGGRTINGIDNSDWNRASDKMLEARGVKFDTYADFDKERELQRLFGHGKNGIEYDAALDKNIQTTRMTEYFRDTDSWSTVTKIPARDFFDFNKAINASEISQSDLDKLISTGVVKDVVRIDGSHDYSFVHENELKRLSSFYGEFDKLNAEPIGDESIERYVARLTRNVHQTDNGVYYVIREDAPINDKMLDDGIIERRVPGSRYTSGNNYANRTYNTGNYNPNTVRLANRASSIIRPYLSSWTRPVRMTGF